jgi:AraC-like DNA-binding protein
MTPIVYKGGLPRYRLKRVLDYIAESLGENISLSQLAAIAGMSPHYFSELFKQSTGRTPHNYVLLQRVERAKQHLRDPKGSIIDAGLNSGLQNPSHFARVFRKLEASLLQDSAQITCRGNHSKAVDDWESVHGQNVYRASAVVITPGWSANKK